MRGITLKLAVGALAAAGAAGQSKAAVVATDGFESYAIGGATGLNGGTGYNSPYVSDNSNAVNIAAAPLSYVGGSVASSGGAQALQILAAATGSVSNANGGVDNGTLGRTFASQTGTVYVSFLLRASNTSMNEFFQIGLSNGTGGEPAISAGASGVQAFNFTFFGRIPGGAAVTSSTVMSPNTTYLLVLKASKGSGSTNYNQLDLFVNPTSDIEPTAATASRTADGGIATITSLNYRTARFTNGDVLSVDNVTIGTMFADVVPVPEPATTSLVAGTALLLLRRRPRRIA